VFSRGWFVVRGVGQISILERDEEMWMELGSDERIMAGGDRVETRQQKGFNQTLFWVLVFGVVETISLAACFSGVESFEVGLTWPGKVACAKTQKPNACTVIAETRYEVHAYLGEISWLMNS
jgi:hypothetical protein